MIKKIKALFRRMKEQKELKARIKKHSNCYHYNTTSKFMDLHKGMGGQETKWVIYFRSNHRCLDCGKRWTHATEIPKYLEDIIERGWSEYCEAYRKIKQAEHEEWLKTQPIDHEKELGNLLAIIAV